MRGFNLLKRIFLKISAIDIFKDSFWAFVGVLSTRGLSLLSGMLIAKFLGKSVFGEYGMLKNSAMALTVFTTLGLGYTATSYISKLKFKSYHSQRKFIKNVYLITVFVSFFIAFSAIIFSTELSKSYFHKESLNSGIILISFWLILNALTSSFTGIIAGYGMFKNLALLNVSSGILGFLFTVLLSYHYGLYGAIFALIISQLIICVFYYYAIEKKLIKVKNLGLSIQEENANEFTKKYIIFNSLPIAFQELLYTIVTWLSFWLLLRFSNYGEIGAYSVAMQWLGVILFIPAILCNVILSHLSSSSKEGQDSIVKKMLFVNILATFIPSILVFIFTKQIIGLYGESYLGIENVLNTVVFTSIFMSVINVFSQLYIANDKSWKMFFLKMVKDIITIGFLILFLTKSIFGASISFAVSNLISNFVFMLILFLLYKREKK